MQKLQKLLYTTAEAKAVLGCGTTRLYELKPTASFGRAGSGTAR